MLIEFVPTNDEYDVIVSDDLPMPPRIGEVVNIHKNEKEIKLKIVKVEYFIDDDDKYRKTGAVCTCETF